MFIPFFGEVGAAFATLSTLVLSGILNLAILKRFLGIPFIDAKMGTLWFFVILGIIFQYILTDYIHLPKVEEKGMVFLLKTACFFVIAAILFYVHNKKKKVSCGSLG